jgi:hypothetical protein
MDFNRSRLTPPLGYTAHIVAFDVLYRSVEI